tara:strand:- start:234 stop:1271 length:1038 start_codon:yes stop_codon:yes gene_type:complete
MSSLLEQAVIDAAALKEAAIKNAENAVLEKYAPEVKKALEQLLEAEEDLGLGDEEAAPMEPEAEDSAEPSIADDMPPAYAEGEKLCPCPEEEEEVTIDLDQLMNQVEAEEEAGGLGMDDTPMDREDMDLAMPEDEEEPMMENLEITEDDLTAIIGESIKEAMTVDIKPVPHGHTGGGTQAEIEEAELMALAAEQDSETKEENAELRKAVDSLSEKVNALKTRNTELVEEQQKYLQAVKYMKDKVDEVNLSNAKLVYVNKVLNSASLNERQKTKIVDALSKSQTIEEAKVIYETLQSAVGGTPNKAPESLSEAIRRAPKTLPRRKRNDDKLQEQTMTRMRRLAGLE